MEREVGGGIGIWNTCKPVAVSFQYMTKSTTKRKKEKKNQPAKARDVGLIPGLERSPWKGNGNPPQYSCLGNHMDRGDWRATVYRLIKRQIQLSEHSHTLFLFIDFCFVLFFKDLPYCSLSILTLSWRILDGTPRWKVAAMSHEQCWDSWSPGGRDSIWG